MALSTTLGEVATALAGRMWRLGDKLLVSGRVSLWGNAPAAQCGVQPLIDHLLAMPRILESADGYSLIPVHVWSHFFDDVAHVVRAARQRRRRRGAAVGIVPPHQRACVDRELHVRLARRRHRWPQSFLVLRWHRELLCEQRGVLHRPVLCRETRKAAARYREACVSLVRSTSYSVVTCRGRFPVRPCAGQNVARQSGVSSFSFPFIPCGLCLCVCP